MPAASLEGVSPTLTYFSVGPNQEVIELPEAPTAVGNYQVYAFFGSSTDYTYGNDTQSFSIFDSGATLTGSSAASTTGGVDGVSAASLVNATFTYSNLGATAFSFIASIDWGDGTAPDATATISGSNGNFTVNDSHLYYTTGSENFTITVTDSGGLTALVTGVASVADSPLADAVNVPFIPFKGQDFSGTVASFTDTDLGSPTAPTIDPTDYSAAITWGDGSTTPGTIAYAGTPGQFTVNASGTPHQYTQEGLQAGNFHVAIQHDSLAPVSTPAIPVVVADMVTVVLIDGLQFTTSGDFVDLGGVYTTSDTVQVGFSPAPGAAFTPIATLDGGTTIDANDQTFSNSGAVSEALSGSSMQLLAAGFTAGSSIAALVDPAGEGIPVAGQTLLVGSSPFVPSAVTFAHDVAGNPEMHLQGQLTLPDDLLITAGPTNFVDLDEAGLVQTGTSSGSSLGGALTVGGISISLPDLSLTDSQTNVGGSLVNVFTISGDSLITVDGLPSVSVFVSGSVTSNSLEAFALQLESSFGFALAGGVTVTSLDAKPLTFTYSSSDDSFTVSGGAEVGVPGLSDNPFFVTAAGTISNGTLQSLQFTVGSSQTLSVAGVTVTTTPANPLSLTFLDFLTPKSRLIVQGGAIADVPGLNGSLSVTAQGTVRNGILQCLDLGLATDVTFTMDGLSISPTTMSLEYLAANGAQFTVTGNASIQVPGVSNPFSITASGTVVDLSGTAELHDLSLALASDQTLTVAGVSIATSTDNPLTFGYVASLSNQFTLTGGAAISIPELSGAIDVTAAGTVSANVLQGLTLTAATTAALSVDGLSLTPTSLKFGYQHDAGNQFAVSGHALVSIAQLGNNIDVTATGTVSNNTLQSLTLALASTPYTVAGVTLSNSSFALSYTPAQLTLSGGATLTIPETTGAITVAASGTVTNTLQTLTLTASSTASFSLGGVTFVPSELTFAYDAAASWFHMAGAGSATFPAVGLVNVTFAGNFYSDSFSGNVLRDFTVTVTAATTYDFSGVSITPTNLTIVYGNNNFYLAGAVTVGLPILGTYHTMISCQIVNGVVISLTFEATSVNSTLSLAGGVSVSPTSMTITYQHLAAGDQFTAAGTASARFPQFGSPIVTSLSGIVLNGVLQTLTFTASTANGRVTLPGGLTVSPSGMVFTYTAANDQFLLGGSASITVPGLPGTFTVTAVGTVSDNTLQNVTFTTISTTSFTIAGVKVSPAGFTFSYTAPGSIFMVGGTGSIAVPTLGTFTVTAAGTVSANTLKNLTFTTTSTASFTIAGATIAPLGLTFSYAAAGTTFMVGGSADVIFPNPLGSLAVTAKGTVSNNALTSFTLTESLSNSSPWTVMPGVSITPKTLALTYDASPLQFGISGTAGVVVNLLGLNTDELKTDVSLGGTFANGTLQSLFVGLSNASFLHLNASLPIGTGTSPRIQGELSGPITITVTGFGSTPHLAVSGASAQALADAELSVSGIPGLTNASYDVGFLLGVNSAGVIDQATLDVMGSLSASFSVFTLKVTNPDFSYQANPAFLSLSGSASASLGSFATAGVDLGDGTQPGLVWKNGALQSAYLRNFQAGFIIPNVGSVNIVNFAFNYQPNGSPILTAGGQLKASIFGQSFGPFPVPTIDFTNGNLASFSLFGTYPIGFAGFGASLLNAKIGIGLDLTSFSPTLTLSGSGTIDLAGTRLNATFGSGSTPGLTFRPGSALPIQADIELNGDLGLAGFLTLHTSGLALSYDVASGTFEVTGACSAEIDDLGVFSVNVTLGDSAHPGLSFNNGILQSVNVTLSTGTKLDFGLFEATTGSDVTFSYDKTDGTLQMYGGATAELPHLSYLPSAQLGLEFGTATNPGLLIDYKGAITSISASVTADVTYDGLTLAGLTGGLKLQGDTLSIWGDGTMKDPFGLGDSLGVSLGSAANPGLIITDGLVTQIVIGVNGTLKGPGDLFEIQGGFTLGYLPGLSGFNGYGAVRFAVPGLFGLNVSMGSDLEHAGLIITNGVVTYLNVATTDTFSIAGFSITLNASGSINTAGAEFAFGGSVDAYSPSGTPVVGNSHLGGFGGTIFLDGSGLASSYVYLYGKFRNENVGIEITLSGAVSLAVGDPVLLTYDPTAPYMDSLDDLGAAYVEASNGEVDPADVYVTNDQFVSYFQQKAAAAALAANLAAAGERIVDSGPSLTISPLVQQGAGADAPASMLFTVTLANPPAVGPVTVDFTTEDETALANVDYVPRSGTLTFLPGQTEQTIAVPILGQTEAVPHKLFEVVLSNPTDAGVASSVGVGDILYSHFLTATTVTSSSTEVSYGQDVTFTATVTNADAASSPGIGMVHFFDGDVELGEVALVNGQAKLTVPGLSVGSHSITVEYTGWQIPGYSYLASTSSVIEQTVNAADQTMSFAAVAGHTYGDLPFLLDAVASSGLPVEFSVVSGPAFIEGGVLSITGAGDVVIEASQPGNDGYHAAIPMQQSFQVTPAPLVFTVDDQGMRYGDTIPTLTGSFSGFVNGDDATSIAAPPTLTVDPAVGAPGSYVISASGAAAANYEISYVAGMLTVAQAISAVTLSPSMAITTQGEVVTFDVSVAHASGSGTPTGSVTFYDNGVELKTIDLTDGSGALSSDDWSVGDHMLTVMYNGDANFMTNNSAATTLTIQPIVTTVDNVDLTTSATGDETYGQSITLIANVTLAAISGSPTGVVQFYDGSTLLTTVPVVGGTASTTTNNLMPDVHDITAVFVGDDDYEVDSINLFVSVAVATPTLTVAAPGGVYSGQAIGATAAIARDDGIPSATLEGVPLSLDYQMLDGDGHVTADLGAVPPVNAGSYQVIVTFAGSADYAPGSMNVAFTITSAPLTVDVNNQSRLFGQSNPTFTVSYAGFVAGQDPSVLSGALAFGTGAVPGSDVGEYAVGASGLASQNYAISYEPGVLSVDAAPLTVAVNGASRTYGQANPTFTVSYAGFVAGQDPSVLSGALAFGTGAVPGSNVGEYAVGASGLASQNYAISYEPGVLSVDAAPLTVVVNGASRTYGQSNPTFTVSYAGFVAGQDPSVLSGALAFGTGAVPGSNVGEYAVGASGLASQNYAISYEPGVLSVDAAPLTVVVNGASRTYGQSNPTFTVSYAGFVAGQDPSVLSGALAFGTGAVPGSNVGEYAVGASGLASQNYAISYEPGVLSVDAAPLTVVVNGASRTYGQANPTFTVSYAGFVAGQDPSVLSGALAFGTGAVPGSNVGEYAVGASGLASQNYAISYEPGVLSVDPAVLTLTAVNKVKSQMARNPRLTFTESGFVLGQSAKMDFNGAPVLSTTATKKSPIGKYSIVIKQGTLALINKNYTFNFINGILRVVRKASKKTVFQTAGRHSALTDHRISKSNPDSGFTFDATPPGHDDRILTGATPTPKAEANEKPPAGTTEGPS